MTDQTRPSWDDAPEWARFLAQDGTGNWYWWEIEPRWTGTDYDEPRGKCAFAVEGTIKPGHKEQRP